MKCNQIYASYLITKIILEKNKNFINGNIINIEKIHRFFKKNINNITLDEIIEILDCLTLKNILEKTDIFVCKNGHFFVPNEDNFKNGFTCDKCIQQNFDEEKSCISPDKLKFYYEYSTYKIKEK